MRIPTFQQYKYQASMMSDQFDELSHLNDQANSGHKIQLFSEDPVLALQINTGQDYLSTLQGYSNNGVLAQSRYSLLNTSTQNAVSLVSSVQTLLKSAQDGTQSASARSNIAQTLQGYLNTLLSIANTQDATGQYVFSGSNNNSAAYAQQNGNYVYQGSSNGTQLDISPNTSIPYNQSGYEIFGDIPTGNGTFTVSANSANTGTAFISPGTAASGTAFVPDTYTITFVTNSANQLAYEVVGATSGQVIPPSSVPVPDGAPAYDPNAGISFNGVNLGVAGQPAVGDSFQVQPSTKQNLFNTIQSAINLLSNPVTNTAQYNQAISQLDSSVSQVFTHLSNYLSQVGVNSAAVNTQVKTNSDTVLEQQTLVSNLENADLPAVYSAYMQQSLILQTTQAAYMKMQETMTKLLQMQI